MAKTRSNHPLRMAGTLKRQFGSVTQKMLTQQLQERERDGLVHRRVYAKVPPRVEYSLTGRGESLLPVLQAMYDWGEAYAAQKADPAENR